jgi:hypothetical protein
MTARAVGLRVSPRAYFTSLGHLLTECFVAIGMLPSGSAPPVTLRGWGRAARAGVRVVHSRLWAHRHELWLPLALGLPIGLADAVAAQHGFHLGRQGRPMTLLVTGLFLPWVLWRPALDLWTSWRRRAALDTDRVLAETMARVLWPAACLYLLGVLAPLATLSSPGERTLLSGFASWMFGGCVGLFGVAAILSFEETMALSPDRLLMTPAPGAIVVRRWWALRGRAGRARARWLAERRGDLALPMLRAFTPRDVAHLTPDDQVFYFSHPDAEVRFWALTALGGQGLD